MGRGLTLIFASLCVAPSVQLAAQDYRAQALRILRSVPLIDGHNDIPDAIRERGGLDSVDLSRPQPRLHTDIARLRAGGVGAQFWAAYVPVSPRSSRSTSSNVLCGAKATSTGSPFTTRESRAFDSVMRRIVTLKWDRGNGSFGA